MYVVGVLKLIFEEVLKKAIGLSLSGAYYLWSGEVKSVVYVSVGGSGSSAENFDRVVNALVYVYFHTLIGVIIVSFILALVLFVYEKLFPISVPAQETEKYKTRSNQVFFIGIVICVAIYCYFIDKRQIPFLLISYVLPIGLGLLAVIASFIILYFWNVFWFISPAARIAVAPSFATPVFRWVEHHFLGVFANMATRRRSHQP